MSKKNPSELSIDAQNRIAQEQASKLETLPLDVISGVVDILYKKLGPGIIRLGVAVDIAERIKKTNG